MASLFRISVGKRLKLILFRISFSALWNKTPSHQAEFTFSLSDPVAKRDTFSGARSPKSGWLSVARTVTCTPSRSSTRRRSRARRTRWRTRSVFWKGETYSRRARGQNISPFLRHKCTRNYIFSALKIAIYLLSFLFFPFDGGQLANASVWMKQIFNNSQFIIRSFIISPRQVLWREKILNTWSILHSPSPTSFNKIHSYICYL